MYRSTVKMPVNRCAFHQQNLITHFCKYHQCLLPLCKQCLSIHRKEHATKKGPIDLCSIEEQLWSVQNKINNEIVHLEQVYLDILNKMHHNGQLHHKLQQTIIKERDAVLNSIDLYYDSLIHEINSNLQRKDKWLRQLNQHYNNIRLEMINIANKLQQQQHLRTVIMWNRLQPQKNIEQIQKTSHKEFQMPSMVPCDIQQLITSMSSQHKLTILDLQGDMGFSNLQRVLYHLRYGQQGSTISNKQAGISITRESKVSNRLILSRSTEKI